MPGPIVSPEALDLLASGGGVGLMLAGLRLVIPSVAQAFAKRSEAKSAALIAQAEATRLAAEAAKTTAEAEAAMKRAEAEAAAKRAEAEAATDFMREEANRSAYFDVRKDMERERRECAERISALETAVQKEHDECADRIEAIISVLPSEAQRRVRSRSRPQLPAYKDDK